MNPKLCVCVLCAAAGGSAAAAGAQTAERDAALWLTLFGTVRKRCAPESTEDEEDGGEDDDEEDDDDGGGGGRRWSDPGSEMWRWKVWKDAYLCCTVLNNFNVMLLPNFKLLSN